MAPRRMYLQIETVGNRTGVKMFLRCAGTVEPSLGKDSDQNRGKMQEWTCT